MTRNIDREIARAEKMRDGGDLLGAAQLLLSLIRKEDTPIAKMEEIMNLFIPIYERYLRERGTVRCPECRGWAKIEKAVIKCERCGSKFPVD